MPFKAIMRNLVETIPGARGAIFVDWEGEAVDQYSLDEDVYQLKVMGAYKGVILKLINEAQKTVGSTDINTVTVKMNKYSIVLSPVKEGYYVALVVQSDTIMSRAAYMIRKSVKDLAANM
ncbi:MAG: roadblock/LC7 domain-containing protein [Deltaproteobacteria bacterium]|nr:roadblock/LC7 domain-containing protein [Deltaproteobacteria bacterium]